MLSYKYRNKRAPTNIKSSFQKFAEKEKYTNTNTLKNATLNVPTSCDTIGTLTDCSGRVREAFCNGRVFRNPIAGHRKTLNTTACAVKTQEIYKDPYSKSCKEGACYDRRIRTMNNKGGVKDNNYNYDYGSYLRNRCKTFKQNENRSLQADGTYKSNCSDANKRCTTYKNKNKQYSTNSAVTSSSRIARLKYNTILKSQENNCVNGELCGVYTSNTKYKDKNLEPKLMDTKSVAPALKCTYRRVAGVIRKCYR
jgi:hypothetical protein